MIIPAYNEEPRIGNTLPSAVSFLKQQNYRSEIILVDDGSRDNTVQLAKKILESYPHQLIQVQPNRGKGHAVKQGMLAGRGRYLLFTDADLSTPLELVNDFMIELQHGYDLVVGSRALKDSNIVTHQPFWREWMGRIYNCFAKMTAFKNISDSQCGFKCFKSSVAKDLFSRQKLERFSFDAEIIYLAQQSGYKLLEKPVIWRNSPQSRVNVIRDSLNMFIDLIRIRWLHR